MRADQPAMMNNFGLILDAYFLYLHIIFGLNCTYDEHPFTTLYFFFFIRDLRSRSYGAVSPIRIRHSERAAFLFRSRTVSLRLPGSLTTPVGGWYHTLRGVITRLLMRAHACELQFRPKTMRFKPK